jgi:hypothetical protein
MNLLPGSARTARIPANYKGHRACAGVRAIIYDYQKKDHTVLAQSLRVVEALKLGGLISIRWSESNKLVKLWIDERISRVSNTFESFSSTCGSSPKSSPHFQAYRQLLTDECGSKVSRNLTLTLNFFLRQIPNHPSNQRRTTQSLSTVE